MTEINMSHSNVIPVKDDVVFNARKQVLPGRIKFRGIKVSMKAGVATVDISKYGRSFPKGTDYTVRVEEVSGQYPHSYNTEDKTGSGFTIRNTDVNGQNDNNDLYISITEILG